MYVSVQAMSLNTIHRLYSMPMLLVCMFFCVLLLTRPLVLVDFFIVKGSAQMGVCRNVWSCIGLTQQVDCYFGLWKESVPQLWWKSCAIPARTLRKCSLKYLIATSVAFLWCAPGGTSSICILYSSCIIVFRASYTSLYNMCFLGIIPALRSLSIIA